ncbi:hypothetical protein O4H61_11095 [Roseovarius aestuarii]|nr:hypothetical protein [Roseovarius aestuarii]
MQIPFDLNVPRFLVCAAITTVMATPGLTQTAELPRAGTCEHRRVITESFSLSTTLDWRGEEAMILSGNDKTPGQVVGLRKHGGGFKFSVLYTDRILGESEIVVFSIPDDGPTQYRMGTVTYHTQEDGPRIVETIAAFNDVVCAVIY